MSHAAPPVDPPGLVDTAEGDPGEPAGLLLPDWLRRTAAREGDRDAYVHRGARLTYRELDRRSDAIAARLHELGLRKGDVLALVLPPRPEYPLCYLAAAKLGVVTTGVNPRYGEGEIEHILRDAGARVVVTIGEHAGRDLAAAVHRIGSRLDALEHVFVVDEDPAAAARRPQRELREGAGEPEARAPAIAPYASLEQPESRTVPAVELSADDAVAIVYTSGTTGRPKGALFTYGNLEAVRLTRGEMLQRHGERVLATGTPFSHVGFMSKIASQVSEAHTTVLLDLFKARTVLETIERERIGYAGGVPAQWSLLLRDPELERFDLSSLRVGAIGGAPFPPDLVRAIRTRLGIELVTRYSCTETAVGTGSAPGDSEEQLATTVGRASAIVELVLLDDGAAPVPTGTVGEVAIRSPAVMRGYWRKPAETAAAFTTDGFYRTGDLGVLDVDGYLRLVGRKKEMYIRGGYNVYPVEVEAALGEHPDVAQSAVIGVPDPVLGEKGAAFVQLRDPGGPAPSLEQVRAFLRERIADYKAPDFLEVLDELPLTPGMKIDKRALLERFTAGGA